MHKRPIVVSSSVTRTSRATNCAHRFLPRPRWAQQGLQKTTPICPGFLTQPSRGLRQ